MSTEAGDVQCGAIEGLVDESVEHRFALARMAWIGVTKANRHKNNPKSMTISYKELERLFGRSGFNEMAERLDFLKTNGHWLKDEGITREFWFSPSVRTAIADYFERSHSAGLTRLIMADGKALKKVPAGVASKDKKGVTTKAWTGAKSLAKVTVNLEALELLRIELVDACDAHRAAEIALERSVFPEVEGMERAVMTINKVQVLSRTDVAGLGAMSHHYQESQSGRLYPVGISLASAQSVVKDAALEGHWEYDISNCHFAITVQMARNYGYECVALAHYLGNKKSVREGIACDIAVHVNKVKKCLLALLYGAKGTIWHDSAFVATVGEEAAAKLLKNSLFMALQGDVARARNHILTKCERTPKGFVKNEFGKSIPSTTKDEQQFAHLLQGVEARALQAVVNAYPEDIVLVQHDGFVSKRKLETAEISNAIHKATGYSLQLEEQCLKPLASDYFSTH
jgi:hypothetical protein